MTAVNICSVLKAVVYDLAWKPVACDCVLKAVANALAVVVADAHGLVMTVADDCAVMIDEDGYGPEVTAVDDLDDD